jgi:phage terminase large subunit-like protein
MTTKIDECTQYAKDVVEGRILACSYVRLACQRHLDDLLRRDIWFDAEAGKKFFRFCARYLKHYKGPMRGQPIKLNPWQKFVFGCIYGWKLVEHGVKLDIWRFNFVYIEIPRKNGKTTIAAAGAAYDCMCIEDTGVEVYCVATKEDQAKLLYNDVAAYIAGSPELADAFEILKGKNTIYATDSARTSFIKPLGSDSQRQDGLNPFSVYADELHAWPEEDLWNVMADAFGARDNWHMIAITTAGNNREGICYKKRDALINILEGRVHNDNMFGVIYTVEEEEQENYTDEQNWLAANPNLNLGKSVRYMRNKSHEATTQPSMLNPFLNKQLNIWTDSAEAWLSMKTWALRAREYDLDSLRYKFCTGAFDLARVSDLSAMAYVFPKQPGLDRVHLWADFYMPKVGVKERGQEHGVDYLQWEKEGLIKLTPGKTTDYNFIREDIKTRAKQIRVTKIMYDRHFAGELVQNLTNDGFTLEEIGMGFLSMNSPSCEMERMLIEDEICHPNNKILNWNARNVVVERDAADNIKPSKELSKLKIDGVVASIMGIADIITNAPKVSKYETQSLVVVGGRQGS